MKKIRLYDSAWNKASRAYLRHNPWCEICKRKRQRVQARVVDHIKPHRGNTKLFWDKGNWWSLCFHHHNSTKQSAEKSRFKPVSVDGWPIDEKRRKNARPGRYPFKST